VAPALVAGLTTLTRTVLFCSQRGPGFNLELIRGRRRRHAYGMTAVEGADADEAPIASWAATVKVYPSPSVSFFDDAGSRSRRPGAAVRPVFEITT
jgi:hypothetical protein